MTSERCSSAISSPAAAANPAAAAEARSTSSRRRASTRSRIRSRWSSETRRPAYPARRADLGGQPLNVSTDAEHDPGAGQLARVVAGVDGGGHHQQRPAPGRGGVRAQHLPRLGGVGRSEDERQRHRPILARADDGTTGPGQGGPGPRRGGSGGRGLLGALGLRRGRLGGVLGLRRLGALPGPGLVELHPPLALVGLLTAPGGLGSSCRSGP